jgi:hypothetical protein
VLPAFASPSAPALALLASLPYFLMVCRSHDLSVALAHPPRQFAVYAYLAVNWASLSSTNSKLNQNPFEGLKKIFYGITLLIGLLSFGLPLAMVLVSDPLFQVSSSPAHHHHRHHHQANLARSGSWVMAGLTLAISLAVLVFGIRLVHQIRKSAKLTGKKAPGARRLAVSTVTLAVAFIMQSLLWVVSITDAVLADATAFRAVGALYQFSVSSPAFVRLTRRHITQISHTHTLPTILIHCLHSSGADHAVGAADALRARGGDGL